MSYSGGAALQRAVFQQLAGDAQVQALAGGHVYDAIPPGVVPQLYVALGPERVRDASDASGAGAVHDFDISVVSEASGFLGAKALAAAVSDALQDVALVPDRGRLVGLWFRGAKARHVDGARRIDLSYRARVELE
jgi:hypothetical protein